MLPSCVYIAILILVNLNYFIECGGKRQTVCLKELNAFAVQKTTGNASSDTRPNICSNNTGCCNKTIENEMKAQITKKLMNLIQRHNEKARRQFKDVYDDLKDLYQKVLDATSASTVDFLQSNVKGNIAQHATPHIHTLFNELRTSVTNKDLHVKNHTTKFFTNIYPLVYQYMVAKRKLPGEFADCLKDKVHLIVPYEKVPQTLTDFLNKKLFPVQQYLRSLQSIGHILNIIDNVELSDECSSALVKMSYCSLCDSIRDVKPCSNYCNAILSSCLYPYSQIEDQWSLYITKLQKSRNLLSKSLDASKMFARLQELLSESISHASHSNVETKVKKHCGNITDYTRNKIITLKRKQTDSTRDLGNGDLYLTTDVHNTYDRLPTANDMNKKLSFLANNLSDIKGHLTTFHNKLCADEGLASSTHKCWTGTSVGRNREAFSYLVDNTALKPNNSQTIKDDVLLFLRNAITDIKKIKPHRLTSDGSGYITYGSGSGQGSGASGEPDIESSVENGDDDDGDDDDDDDDNGSSGTVDSNVDHVADPSVNPKDDEEHTTKIIILFDRSRATCLYYTRTLVVGLLLFYVIFSR